ncbi:acyl carrier protein [Sphingobium estronivorans]|uniref:acyl carrier protein n=1 Tax=Sphingobium estronivorans TaxID=1577690 RepID=UPI001F081162|nr:phosphopantetheine-binding protein [Sphingobium estronivorans]
MSVLERVKAIVGKQIGRDPASLDDNSDLAEAGYESLDVIETVFAIEEEFGIDIPFNANVGDSVQLRTVGDIVTVVEDALAKRQSR